VRACACACVWNQPFQKAINTGLRAVDPINWQVCACVCVCVRMGNNWLILTVGWSVLSILAHTACACVCRLRYGTDADGDLPEWPPCAVDLDNIWRCACVCACVCMETGLRWHGWLASSVLLILSHTGRCACVRVRVRLCVWERGRRHGDGRVPCCRSLDNRQVCVRVRCVCMEQQRWRRLVGSLCCQSWHTGRCVCAVRVWEQRGRSDGRLASVLSILCRLAGACVRPGEGNQRSQMAMYWSFHCAVDLGHNRGVRARAFREPTAVSDGLASSRRSLELTTGRCACACVCACEQRSQIAITYRPPCRRSGDHTGRRRVCVCVRAWRGNNGRRLATVIGLRAVDPYQLAVCVRVCVCACMGNGRRWRSSLASVSSSLSHNWQVCVRVRACVSVSMGTGRRRRWSISSGRRSRCNTGRCVRVCAWQRVADGDRPVILRCLISELTPAGACVCVLCAGFRHGRGSDDDRLVDSSVLAIWVQVQVCACACAWDQRSQIMTLAGPQCCRSLESHTWQRVRVRVCAWKTTGRRSDGRIGPVPSISTAPAGVCVCVRSCLRFSMEQRSQMAAGWPPCCRSA
jgi:hypothetical protein